MINKDIVNNSLVYFNFSLGLAFVVLLHVSIIVVFMASEIVCHLCGKWRVMLLLINSFLLNSMGCFPRRFFICVKLRADVSVVHHFRHEDLLMVVQNFLVVAMPICCYHCRLVGGSSGILGFPPNFYGRFDLSLVQLGM